MDQESSVAVFIDVENMHYSTLNVYSETIDWAMLVNECKKYGKIASIQAFCDWTKFETEVPKLQANGIQPIFVPLSQNGKSSLDCYLTVSAMKLFFQNNTVDTLILASGDRDYIPLIVELKAQGNRVLILAIPDTLSRDLKGIVDDVIPYSRTVNIGGKSDDISDSNVAYEFMIETLKEIEANSVNDRWVNLAQIGIMLKRKNSSFNHRHYGYTKLVEMLDAIPQIELKYDDYARTIAFARIRHGDDTSQKTSVIFHGTIVNLKPEGGYGFIKPENEGENLFFHQSKLENCTLDELSIEDKVKYRTYNTDRGECAENIYKL